MRRIFLVVAAITAGTAMPSVAGERTGYAAIASGDWSRAERTLVAERRIFPDRPELMLNLAAVYQRTDRAGAAASLYRQVLDHPAVTLDMPNGATRSSHAIASAALARFAPTTLANR